MNIPIPIPGSSGNQDDGPAAGPDDLSLSDVIGKESRINIFAGFTRMIPPTLCYLLGGTDNATGDVDSIAKRLNDQGKQSTVLAPLNSAIQKLPRKPWEDPEDYNTIGAEAYKGEDGESRASRNLRRFVEAHIVPVSPWKEGDKVQSLRGETVWWESKDGKKIVRFAVANCNNCRANSLQIYPGNVEIDSTVDKVDNGEVLSVKSCLNYA